MLRRKGVMIGSPSDTTEERQVITDAIQQWNASNGNEKDIILETVKWETHVTPDLEGRPQEMINKKLIPQSDFIIVVFRSRAGTPTGVEISRTIEEVQEFMRHNKYVAVYFHQGDINLRSVDPDQLKIVREFKREIQQKGIPVVISLWMTFLCN